MARQPRLSLTHQLHHVLWRGNPHQPVLVDEADRQLLARLLLELAADHGVALHAWALMPDHIHLLLTPLRDGALSVFMQAVGRRYVQAFNRRHGRRGTLWEGRYRSTVLEPEPWLLRAMVWMDSHPWRSGVAPQPGAHPWTTAAHYLGLRTVGGLTVPPQFWALGNTPFAREAAYRTLLEQGCDAASTQALTDAAIQGWALGSAPFVAHLQAQSARRLEKAKPGRPPRVEHHASQKNE
ncbi:MAG: transposase [Polaromonas sp.]|nr:transposase [Polaromonas sp.]